MNEQEKKQEKKQNDLPEEHVNELSEEGSEQDVETSSMETQDITSEEAHDASSEIDQSNWQSTMNDGADENEPPPEEHDDLAEAGVDDSTSTSVPAPYAYPTVLALIDRMDAPTGLNPYTIQKEPITEVGLEADGIYLIRDGQGNPVFQVRKEGVYRIIFEKDDYAVQRDPFCTCLYVGRVREMDGTNLREFEVTYAVNQGYRQARILNKKLTEEGVEQLLSEGVVMFPTQANRATIAYYLMLSASQLNPRYRHDFVGWVLRDGMANRPSYTFAHAPGFLSYDHDTDEVVLKPSEISKKYEKAIDIKGDLYAYMDELTPLLKYDTIRLMMGAGVSSILLGYLRLTRPDLMPFLIHLHSNSSRGKTTAARLAVSMNGNPYQQPLSVSWVSTKNAIINLANQNYGLAMILDEASIFQGSMTNIIYELSQGEERLRLNGDMETRQGGEWSTVFLSTGEQGIRQNTAKKTELKSAGVSIRYLEFINLDFMPNAAVAEQVSRMIQCYHGHLGVTLAVYLLRQNPIQMSERFDERREQFRNQLPSSAYRDRATNMLSVVSLALELLMESLPEAFETARAELKEGMPQINEMLIDSFLEQTKDLDIALNAYRTIQELVIKHLNHFKVKGQTPDRTAIYGKVTKKGTHYEVAILRNIVRNWMTAEGYPSTNVLGREWRERGWIIGENDRNERRLRIFDEKEGDIREKMTEKKQKKSEDSCYLFKIEASVIDEYLNEMNLGQATPNTSGPIHNVFRKKPDVKPNVIHRTLETPSDEDELEFDV